MGRTVNFGTSFICILNKATIGLNPLTHRNAPYYPDSENHDLLRTKKNHDLD